MTKKLIFLSLILTIFFVVQKTEAVAPSQRWVCLEAIYCLPSEPESAACAVKNGHRVRLSAKSDSKPLANTDTYVIECLATPDGQICTSAKSDVDTQIYGVDNLTSLQTQYSYVFEGMYLGDGITAAQNPTKSDAGGNVGPFEWQSYTPAGHERKYLALNFFDPSQAPEEYAGGEQQGTLDFETTLKDCVSISWDPFGRVFNSQILEPIAGLQVQLLKKRDDGSFTPVNPYDPADVPGGLLKNPFTTAADGYFNFVVPDATYKLYVISSNYTFPNDPTKLNTNYKKAYFDIYPNQTGEEIIQKGKIQHRDIPIDPKGVSIKRDPQLMEYFYYFDKATNRSIIEGKVSHPLTQIKAYSVKSIAGDPDIKTRYREIKLSPSQNHADKFGKFRLEINHTLFKPDEMFGEIELMKVDLTLASKNNSPLNLIGAAIKKLIATVNAQQQGTLISFDPILNYLEGYAHDAYGQVIPNATVGVYLSFAKKPYYETKTDAGGYFKITSEFLPSMPYQIKYTTPLGSAINESTSKFMAQNAAFVATQSSNLYNYKDRTGKTFAQATHYKSLTPSPAAAAEFGKSGGGLASNKQGTPTPQNASLNSLIVTVLIILVLIGAVGAGLAVYIYKKNQVKQTGSI